MTTTLKQIMKEGWKMPRKPFCAKCLQGMEPVAISDNGKWGTYMACDCGTLSWDEIEWPLNERLARGEWLEELGFRVIIKTEDDTPEPTKEDYDDVTQGWARANGF